MPGSDRKLVLGGGLGTVEGLLEPDHGRRYVRDKPAPGTEPCR
jgi:hypothetical protein